MLGKPQEAGIGAAQTGESWYNYLSNGISSILNAGGSKGKGKGKDQGDRYSWINRDERNKMPGGNKASNKNSKYRVGSTDL